MVSRLNLHDLKQNFAPGDLEGKRLCISSDASSEALDPVATSLIKQATGGDVISADVKYKARIQFRCEAVFVLVTNHAVRTKDPDDAFFSKSGCDPFSICSQPFGADSAGSAAKKAAAGDGCHRFPCR